MLNSPAGTLLSIISGSLPATILTFHSVAKLSEMRYLDTIIQTLAEEYRVVSLSQLVCWLKTNQKFPPRTVVITFDDGFKDQLMIAAPALKARNLSACFFIATDTASAGRATWKWKGAEGIEMMSWADVRQLADEGFEIGSHTCSHRVLSSLSVDDIRRELRVSKEAIEQHVGQKAQFFAYPLGGRQHINATCIEEVKITGFECCLSAYGGVVFPKQDPFNLRRVSISDYHCSKDHLRYELNPYLGTFRTLRDDFRSIY